VAGQTDERQPALGNGRGARIDIHQAPRLIVL
jgi:hypothetical protein